MNIQFQTDKNEEYVFCIVDGVNIARSCWASDSPEGWSLIRSNSMDIEDDVNLCRHIADAYRFCFRIAYP